MTAINSVENTMNQDNLKNIWGDLFQNGKIRISWSQTRGGFAIFVSGRMEGELHDTPEEAVEWLKKVGVKENRLPRI